MEKFSKIKNIIFIIFSLLFFNQFLLNGYALNYKKIDLGKSGKNNLQRKLYNSSNFLIAEKNKYQSKSLKKEEKEIENFAKEIEDFLEETIDQNNLHDLKKKESKAPLSKNNIDKLEKKSTQKDNEKNNSTKEQQKDTINSPDKDVIIKENNLKLPLPSRSKISTSEFKVPSRGYIKLKGPKITLNFKKSDALETLKLIAKLANYGIVIVQEQDSIEEKNLDNPKITANFENVDISDVFNSILLSSNLQAIVENNIIFVGENILNKSLKSKISKTYRLNQVNAGSVADYLSTLGAQISKVSVLSGSNAGAEVADSFLNKKEFKDKPINSYGIEGGPLLGLVGTADLRLQTITLIGTKDLMKTAEKYIENLDVRHRQVALTIKIIDVTLSKTDIKNNVFELRNGNTRIINNSGLSLRTGNFDSGNPPSNANVLNAFSGGVAQNKFMNWLESKITNENAKILASPTLILGENSNLLNSGAAAVDDSLSSATIGRPFKNEGFIKVGDIVVTSFSQTQQNGVITCIPTEATAGITFGAKVEKIDDNGFVTFALSPAISSVTKSETIENCGIQNTLNVRKLDTGSIRVKNEDTLILTGVLQDSDNILTSKMPILGDVPILGSLFRSNLTQKRKNELIILVTPKILKDE